MLLQERVQALEKQLEAKDDECFELSATLATIQAETSFEIKKIEKETTLQVNLAKEELRRTTQEANQAHMALRRLQRQQQQQPTRQVPVPPTNVDAPRMLHSSSSSEQPRVVVEPPSTIFVASSSARSIFYAGQVLARHLLLNNIDAEDSIYRFLQHAQHTTQMQETTLVWQIMQISFHEKTKTAKLWLQQALDWSPMSRAMLRQACCGKIKNTTRQRVSRIQVSSSFDLRPIADCLLNPLWKPEMAPPQSQSESNPFNPLICTEWMAEISSDPEDWPVVSTLLQDCACEDERSAWFQLISKDLVSQWEAFAQANLAATVPRRVHSIPPFSGPIMSKSAFLQSLHLLSDTFRKPIEDRAFLAILLDVWESEAFSKACDVHLMKGILGVLSIQCETDMTPLRTKMATTSEEMAQSALGVAILVLTTSQLTLEELKDDNKTLSLKYKDYARLRDNVIRLFHQVLRGRPSEICFTSLVDERKHDYLGVCSQILVSRSTNIIGNADESIKAMVRFQMDEIQADLDDEEEIRMK